jgi:ketopantoate reductase
LQGLSVKKEVKKLVFSGRGEGFSREYSSMENSHTRQNRQEANFRPGKFSRRAKSFPLPFRRPNTANYYLMFSDVKMTLKT